MSELTHLPADYAQLLETLKDRIRAAQLRAGLAVNRELVLLYWQIGREILGRQAQQKVGAKVIDRLSSDLKRAFPGTQGFSPRNLKYMRSFAEVWTTEQFVQQAAAQIPWFHNCVLLDKVKDPSEREWYLRTTIQHGWSRNVLVHQIESGLYRRQGRAQTNFDHQISRLITISLTGTFIASLALTDIGIVRGQVAERKGTGDSLLKALTVNKSSKIVNS